MGQHSAQPQPNSSRLDKVISVRFSQEELDQLKVAAECWVDAAPQSSRWQRRMAYYFMVVMLFTGIRPREARDLRWRDIRSAKDGSDTPITVLSVRWRDKRRDVVAWAWVGEYLDRIRVKYVEVGRPAPTKVDLLRRAVEDGILPGLDPDGGDGA